MFAQVRCVVAEPEAEARQTLVAALRALPGISVAGEAGTAGEARRIIEDQRPAAAFIGVSLPDGSGLSLIRNIPPAQRPATVIIASQSDAAPAAFDLDVADFLVRPFDNERLMRACMRLQGRSAPEPVAACIVARQGKRMVRLNPREVAAVHAKGNYVRLEAASGDYWLRTTLAAIEKRLSLNGFRRASRSALVNLAEVESVERVGHGDGVIWLRSGNSIALSRSFRRQLESVLVF